MGEKSRHYFRRKELMGKLEVPLMREVKSELGDNLANVVFQQCPEALREEMGLTPILKGAGETLWISPSDVLIGKVCLKPPLTDKHIKALTHEGIIDIGRNIDRRYWAQMESEKLQALKEQAQYLSILADREKRIAVKRARQEEKEECMRTIEALHRDFEERLKHELDHLESVMLDIQKQKISEAVSIVEDEWQLRLELAVEATVLRLTEEFLENMRKQKEELTQGFKAEMETMETEYNAAIKSQEKFNIESLKQLRHNLECKNISNLMYVLCMERRKCAIEKGTIEFSYKNQIQGLEKKISAQSEEISHLKEECAVKLKKINVREECVLEVIRQFQKFINFALRATPTQAEFLLSVEKMMLFELTQALAQTAPKTRLAKKILQWKSDSEISHSSKTSKSSLIAKDYHQCSKEVSPPGAEETEVLPAIYYNDVMYVREDFRNMFSQGIEMTESNLMWNKDVENLMQILRAQVDKSSVVESEKEIQVENIRSVTLEQAAMKKKASKESPRKSSLCKKSSAKENEEPPLIYCSIPSIKESLPDADILREQSPVNVVKQVIKEMADVDIEPMDTTGLLAANDSLVKLRESRRNSLALGKDEGEAASMLMAVKLSLEQQEKANKSQSIVGGVVSFEDFEAIRFPDQIVLTKPNNRSRTSVTKQNSYTGSRKQSILAQKNSASTQYPRESKLLSTKDSIILHRLSIVENSKPENLPTYIPSLTNEQVSAPLISKMSPHINTSGNEGLQVASKLSLHRNSLELIRRQTKRRDSSTSNMILLPKPPSRQSICANEQIVQKRVSPLTVSHIEVARIPTDIATVVDASVNFCPVQEVYETDNTLYKTDSPWKIYEDEKTAEQETKDNFITKPNQGKVLGEPSGKEHLETSEEFTMHRINSIMDILRDEPSLFKLFISCTK